MPWVPQLIPTVILILLLYVYDFVYVNIILKLFYSIITAPLPALDIVFRKVHLGTSVAN